MSRQACCLVALVCVVAFLVSGCGRPTLPGRQFQGERVGVPRVVATDTPLPEKAIVEWGPTNAKVRVVAFFPNDEPHKPIFEALRKAATEQYPGKVYARYVDYRTPEGQVAFARTQLQVSTILIDGKSAADLPGAAGPRTVDFVQEMGRFWTMDDLQEAIKQAVAAPAKAAGPR